MMAIFSKKKQQDDDKLEHKYTRRIQKTQNARQFFVLAFCLICTLVVAGPTWPQDGPKMPQDGPKLAPRWPQDGARRLQDGPKVAQDGPTNDPQTIKNTRENQYFGLSDAS